MAEEFEDQDLSDSVFWGVKLRNSYVRDADLTGARFFHTWWKDVSIDGIVDGLVVNGVDVTNFVNSHDRWYPLRTQLEPSTDGELREAWSAIQSEWDALFARVATMSGDAPMRSVNGEWSLLDTCRHLVFAMDKWFRWPIVGAREFSPIGLPNTGSRDRDWPGLALDANPSFEEVLAVRSAYVDEFTRGIHEYSLSQLPDVVDILENGTVPALMCFHVVLEEEFEHLRYALRDLDSL